MVFGLLSHCEWVLSPAFAALSSVGKGSTSPRLVCTNLSAVFLLDAEGTPSRGMSSTLSSSTV